MKNVYYTGSKSEWYTIDIANGNNSLTSVTIHYDLTDNTPCVEHTPGAAVLENQKTATCTSTGSYEKVVRCAVCGEEISRTVIVTEQLAHTFGDWVVVEEATSTQEGVQERTCAVCGYTEREAVHFTVNIIASGTCGDNVTWVLYDNGTFAISGTGAMKDYSYDDLPWKSYRSSIRSAIIADGITSIGMSAFGNCFSLTDIIIPDNVNSIGNYAFSNCTSLTKINLPEHLISIGNYAFTECHKLTSVTLSSSVTYISNYAFNNCIELKDVYYAGSKEEWNTINIDYEGNEHLASATIHYAVSAEPFEITTQPEDITTTVGENVTLTVEATGDGLTYQWQYKRVGGDWTSWKNYKSASMTAKATAAWNGMKIRCIITDSNGNTVTTREVQSSFKTNAVTITSEPQDITTAIGESVTLSVAATGSGLTYQWQYKKSGGDGTSWKNYKSASMTTKASSAWDGMKIRCIITDANGNTATTREVQSSFASTQSEDVIIESKNVTILEEIEAVEIPQEETEVMTTEEYVESPQEETTDINSDTTEEVAEILQDDNTIEETVETVE